MTRVHVSNYQKFTVCSPIFRRQLTVAFAAENHGIIEHNKHIELDLCTFWSKNVTPTDSTLKCNKNCHYVSMFKQIFWQMKHNYTIS